MPTNWSGSRHAPYPPRGGGGPPDLGAAAGPLLGALGLPGRIVRAARTSRRRLLALPGRLTIHAGRWTLHLPARWPWQRDFTEALSRIRALPAAA